MVGTDFLTPSHVRTGRLCGSLDPTHHDRCHMASVSTGGGKNVLFRSKAGMYPLRDSRCVHGSNLRRGGCK